MTHQPEDMGEAYAELQQEDLSIVDEDALTANTTLDYERVGDEDAGPLTEQSQEDPGEPLPPAATGEAG